MNFFISLWVSLNIEVNKVFNFDASSSSEQVRKVDLLEQ